MFHSFERFFVVRELLIKCFGDAGVSLIRHLSGIAYQVIMSRPYSAGSDYHVVILAHTLDGLDNFIFIIRNDFNPFQFNAQLETISRCLLAIIVGEEPKWAEFVSIVLDERTSSPMTIHPAVLIIRSDNTDIVYVFWI